MTVALERRTVELHADGRNWYALGESARRIREVMRRPGSLNRVHIAAWEFEDVKDTLMRRGFEVVI